MLARKALMRLAQGLLMAGSWQAITRRSKPSMLSNQLI
jgi:hypothetical protein